MTWCFARKPVKITIACLCLVYTLGLQKQNFDPNHDRYYPSDDRYYPSDDRRHPNDGRHPNHSSVVQLDSYFDMPPKVRERMDQRNRRNLGPTSLHYMLTRNLPSDAIPSLNR